MYFLEITLILLKESVVKNAIDNQEFFDLLVENISLKISLGYFVSSDPEDSVDSDVSDS